MSPLKVAAIVIICAVVGVVATYLVLAVIVRSS